MGHVPQAAGTGSRYRGPMTESRHAGARILIVEDHDDLAEALAHNLQHHGYAPECVRDGRDALFAVRQRVPDLIVLDLSLPRLDGFGMLERLRADGVWCPVLILSARAAAADKVEGFRLGADDYVTKPFTVAELLGRIGALLRRTVPPPPGEPLPRPPAAPAPTAAGRDIIGFTDDELVERFALTTRQAAVARLLARGLTNPEIADALEISRFTVRNHAEQVFAKLGVTSRGQIASALRAAYDADRGSAA
jgi:DNA-binding response OmpR family regulator